MDEKLRVAIYLRVSTEEQRIHGLSIDAQGDILKKWVKDNGHILTGTYVDAGITARKKMHQRKELQRLLNDVENGKIDLIIFTKLDRWFRNISDYYKVQEILDKNNVNWKTILEEYDTSSAGGRLHINIMLSIAQDEADRTSERIKAVFEHKVLNGELTNASAPYGYRIKNNRLVIEENEAKRVKEIFDTYELKCSILATQRWYNLKYNENVSYEFISRMLKREAYIGRRKQNKDFCEPIITLEQFNRINSKKKQSFSRTGKTGAIYIFSSLVICGSCNRTMNGVTCYNPKPRKYYSCRYGAHFTSCTHNKRCREDVIEDKALSELGKIASNNLYSIKVKNKKKTVSDKTNIKRKLTRLKELYVEEMIDMEQYKNDYNEYMKKIEEIERNESENNSIDLESIKSYFNGCDYKEVYEKLDDEHKRLFWHKIIEKISVSDDNEIEIFFKL